MRLSYLLNDLGGVYGLRSRRHILHLPLLIEKMQAENNRRRKEVDEMFEFLVWLIKLPFVLVGWLIKAVVVSVVWLIKLPFVLVAVVLAVVLGLVGGIISVLGVALTPVLGIGLLILPIGLIILLAAWLIAKVL
jgi:hypothetical protein